MSFTVQTASKEKQETPPISLQHLGAILRVTSTHDWNNLKGKPLRVEYAEDGKICRIGHFLNEDWVDV